MISVYGISQTGKSHFSRDVPCQDSHIVSQLDNKYWIAAVADGVGSASHSQIGSRIAVTECVGYCKSNILTTTKKEDILSLLKAAYSHAFYMILKESENCGFTLDSFDTTLHTVVYDGTTIWYGHSGDGGIIGLNTNGKYTVITKPQKGADCESVIPLRAGPEAWVFDTYDDLASVMILTDGMLETICNYLLKRDNQDHAYVPLASFFADPKGFTGETEPDNQIINAINEFVVGAKDYNPELFYSRLTDIYKKRIHNNQEIENIIQNIKKNNTPIKMMQSEQDDKTIVCLINHDAICMNQDSKYYSEVDWKSLQQRLYYSLYPYLFNTDKETAKPSESEQKETDGKDSMVYENKKSECKSKKKIITRRVYKLLRRVD